AANNLIRQVNISTGVVTTLAGSGSPGNANGTGIGASFNAPYGIVYDGSGVLYVADYNNNQIRKIVIGGAVVSTLAGNGMQGTTDGPGTSAMFHNPTALTLDAAGNLYVADVGNNEIRQVVTASGAVTTVAGSPTAGSSDGANGAAVQFSSPSGIVFVNNYLYVADMSNNEIRQVTPSTGATITVAGAITAGSADGFGTNAAFFQPYGITTDGNGNLYVSDMGNNSIRKIFLSTMNVYTYAGGGTSGSTNGSTLNAKFNAPHGLVTDATGDVFIADANNNEIRKIGVCATAITATITGQAANNTICYGLNDTVIGIENGGINPPYTFYWNGTASTDTLVANLPSSITYSLVIVDGIGCHSDTVTANVTVDNPGAITLTNFGSSPICPGNTDELFATSTGSGGGAYTWTPSVASVGSPYAGNASPTVTTTYTLTENADGNGCTPTPGTIVVPVFTPPVVSIVGNVMSGLNICSGNADTLRAIAIGSGPFMYNWSNDGTTDTVIAYSASEYNVNVTDVNGCYSNADSVIRSG
ncbi:MAG TPA: hypothetical protein VN922_07515, partial [Bacteroidia bacterium]|nr:hypothetical protein [Bacteroidia bacterium]